MARMTARTPANPSEAARPADDQLGDRRVNADASSIAQALTISLRNDGPRSRSDAQHRTCAVREVLFQGVGLASIGESPRVPGVGMLAEKQRDADGRVPARRTLRAGQPRPPGFARQAQHIQPRRIVPIEPRRKDRAFPGRSRQLDTVELRQDRPEPVDSGQVMRLVNAMPDKQETLEIGRR